ncbi:MAG: hypothetical protein PVJ11_08470 [Syntrophobacterales bacterium]|jgi:hypothetical protein
MTEPQVSQYKSGWPKLALMPLPAKALVTMIILTIAIAMLGALGQIIVHDIIPTFFAEEQMEGYSASEMEAATSADDGETTSGRGDLFASAPLEEKVAEPFYKKEQFVWTLRWTHIHLFGMSMIFIFMGAITLFLDLSLKARTWLVVLPFLGVLVDIAGVWLKGYISPAFFWLHIPGGVLFVAIFVYVSLRALWEMWYQNSTR